MKAPRACYRCLSWVWSRSVLAGRANTPVYFTVPHWVTLVVGSAHSDEATKWAPAPQTRQANERDVVAAKRSSPPNCVFKDQANMDLNTVTVSLSCVSYHSTYSQGMKIDHVRTGKNVSISDTLLTFMAGDRARAEKAYCRWHYPVYITTAQFRLKVIPFRWEPEVLWYSNFAWGYIPPYSST